MTENAHLEALRRDLLAVDQLIVDLDRNGSMSPEWLRVRNELNAFAQRLAAIATLGSSLQGCAVRERAPARTHVWRDSAGHPVYLLHNGQGKLLTVTDNKDVLLMMEDLLVSQDPAGNDGAKQDRSCDPPPRRGVSE